MAGICLVILCGLPASGKSTIVKQLQQDSEKEEGVLPYRFIAVEYDELLPPEVEKSLIEGGDGPMQDSDTKSLWKKYRQDIYKCVDCLISILKNANKTLQYAGPEYFTDIVNTDLWRKLAEKICVDSMQCCVEKPLCILIDDNMYYRSMRYSYYQLARKYKAGFSQIYLQTTVEAALSHNKQRTSNSVTNETIVQMAHRFEEPRPFQNAWEQNTLTLNNMLVLDDTVQQYVKHIINQALRNPVEDCTEKDMEVLNQSREICSENVLHQSDQIMRKLVSEEMVNAKDKGKTKSELQKLAGSLQLTRKQLTEDLKDGKILIPQHIVSMTTDASKDSSSGLFVCLRDMFHKRKDAIMTGLEKSCK